MAEHSKLPWRVETRVVGWAKNPKDNLWSSFVMPLCLQVSCEDHREIAALIVRAVNNIERLEKIEKAARDFSTLYSHWLEDLSVSNDLHDAAKELGLVLAKADARAALSEGPANTEGEP